MHGDAIKIETADESACAADYVLRRFMGGPRDGMELHVHKSLRQVLIPQERDLLRSVLPPFCVSPAIIPHLVYVVDPESGNAVYAGLA
jgi:hypothetical protein